MTTILVVDDDPLIANSIALALTQEGYRVLTAGTGEQALAAAERDSPDLCILDLGLPGIGGVEVCRRLRRHSTAPVLFLSARQDEAHKVAALDAGGDDYVTKPVGTAELAARVRALLRRGMAASAEPPAVLQAGDLWLDPAAHHVTLKGKEVQLTPREFELLRTLMENRGRAMRRQELLDLVWGADWFGDDNVLDVFIRQVRTKVEPDPTRPAYIETVRGVGYRFRRA